MLGITVADAVLVVGLALSLYAAWSGTRAGRTARKEAPPPEGVFSVAGLGLVSTLSLEANTAALQKLAEAILFAANKLAAEGNNDRRHDEIMGQLVRMDHPPQG